MKYHYFVSYYFRTETETGYGDCEVCKESPIADSDELKKIRDNIKEEFNNCKSVTILNWRRFEQAE